MVIVQVDGVKPPDRHIRSPSEALADGTPPVDNEKPHPKAVPVADGVVRPVYSIRRRNPSFWGRQTKYQTLALPKEVEHWSLKTAYVTGLLRPDRTELFALVKPSLPEFPGKLGPSLPTLYRLVPGSRVMVKASFGSKADSRDPLLPRPELGVKQTKSARKRTLPLEGRFSGVSGRTPSFSTGGALLAVSLCCSALIPALGTAGAME